MPSSVGKQQQQQQHQQHIYGMFSGATIKVTSNIHHPHCMNDGGSSSSSSSSQRVESLPECWQREAISLSEHLTGITQVLHIIQPLKDKRTTLHVTRHTLHVTRHTSHVTRHTLHITPHTAHIVLSHVALGAVEHELVAPDVRQSGIQRGFSHVPLHWNSPHAGKRRPVATRRA